MFAVVPMTLYSLFFMVCTQVNHHSPAPSAPRSAAPANWYRHQTATSQNVAADSAALFWAMGGLNLQIEHHLFPTVNHWHLRKLAPGVAAAAARHGVHYPHAPSLGAALAALWVHLAHMGKQPSSSE